MANKSTCDVVEEAASDFEDYVANRNIYNDNWLKTVFKIPERFVNFTNKYVSKYGEDSEGNLLNESTARDFQKAIREEYGPKELNERYAAEIMVMMQGSEMIQQEVIRYILGHEVSMSDVYEERLAKVKDGIDLNGLPISTLRNLYRIGQTVMSAGTGSDLGHGLLGRLKVQFLIPRKLAYREKTGAIYKIQTAINEYGPRIQNKINKYLEPTSERKFGINTIYKDLYGLTNNLKTRGKTAGKDADNLQRLFANLARGRVVYVDSREKARSLRIKEKDYTGPDFYYYTKRDTVIEDKETGAIQRWEDGTPKFVYQNLVKLKDYNPSVEFGNKGDWYVDLTPKGVKLLMGGKNSILGQFRQIDDLVFKEVFEEHKQSIAIVLKPLMKLYGMNRKELALLFNGPKNKQEGLQYKELLRKIDENPEVKKEHQYLKNVFEGNFNIDNLEGIDFEIRRQDEHFPASYSVPTRRRIWEEMIDEKGVSIEKKKDTIDFLKEKRDKGKATDKDTARLLMLLDQVKELEKGLESNLEVLDIMDDMHEDKITDTLITPVRHNKYSKELTNAFDDKFARYDNAAYGDYLRHMYGAIERNILTAKMLEAVEVAESREVKDIVTNIYKLPFNRADIESGFAYWNYDSPTLSNFFKKFKINISPDEINYHTRFLNNWLTGIYLNRPGSAVTNYTAAVQNLIDYGSQRTLEGLKDYIRDKDKWDELIKKSGIIDFSDYFSAALVENAAKTKIEEDLTEEILTYQMRYWVKVEAAEGKKNEAQLKLDALEELNSSIDEVLQESARFNLWVDKQANNTSDKERTAKRMQTFRKQKRLNVVNALSNWAITKDFSMRDSLTASGKMGALKNLANKSKLGRMGKSGLKFWSEALKLTKLTMAESEQFVRTLSFVIGLSHAQKTGRFLKEGNPWDADWTQNDVNKALEMGKTYSQFSNFELSKGGIGSFSYSGLGPLMGKFKIWSHQKWARDWDIIANAWHSVKEEYVDSQGKIVQDADFTLRDPKRFFKQMKKFFDAFKKPGMELRAANPEMAQFKSFVLTQGIMTTLFDFMLFGPIPFRAIMRNVPFIQSKFGRALGSGSSDLVSWVMAVPLMLLSLALGGAWDEDDIDKAWTFYFRKTAFGYLPNLGMDVVLGFFGAANERQKHRENALSVAIPSFVPFSQTVRGTLTDWESQEEDY